MAPKSGSGKNVGTLQGSVVIDIGQALDSLKTLESAIKQFGTKSTATVNFNINPENLRRLERTANAASKIASALNPGAGGPAAPNTTGSGGNGGGGSVTLTENFEKELAAKLSGALDEAFKNKRDFHVNLIVDNLDEIKGALGKLNLTPTGAGGGGTSGTPGVNPLVEQQIRRDYNDVTRKFVSAMRASMNEPFAVKEAAAGGVQLTRKYDMAQLADAIKIAAEHGTYEGVLPGFRVQSGDAEERVFEILRRTAPGISTMAQGAKIESLSPEWDRLPKDLQDFTRVGMKWVQANLVNATRDKTFPEFSREQALQQIFTPAQAAPQQTPVQPPPSTASGNPPPPPPEAPPAGASNAAGNPPPPPSNPGPIYTPAELSAARQKMFAERQAAANEAEWDAVAPDEWARSMLLRVAPLSVPNDYSITELLQQNPKLAERVEARGGELGIGRGRNGPSWTATIKHEPIGSRGKTVPIAEKRGMHRDDRPSQIGTYGDISEILAASPDLAAEVNDLIRSRSITQALNKNETLKAAVTKAMAEGKYPDYVSALVNNRDLADQVLAAIGVDQRAVVQQIIGGVASLPMAGAAKPTLGGSGKRTTGATRRGQHAPQLMTPLTSEQEAELQAQIEALGFSESGEGSIERVRRRPLEGEQFGRYIEGGLVDRLAAEKKKRDDEAKARGEEPSTAYDAAEMASFLSGGPMPPGLGGLLSAIGMGAFTDVAKVAGAKGAPAKLYIPQNDAQRQQLLQIKPGQMGRMQIGGKLTPVERLGPGESAQEFVRQLFLIEFGGQGEDANQKAASLAARLSGIAPWVARGNNPFSGEKRTGSMQGPNTLQDFARNTIRLTQIEEAIGRVQFRDAKGEFQPDMITDKDWQLVGGKPGAPKKQLAKIFKDRLYGERAKLMDEGADPLPPSVDVKETTAMGGLIYTYFQNATKIGKALNAVDRVEKRMAATREQLARLNDPEHIKGIKESGYFSPEKFAEFEANIPNAKYWLERRLESDETLLPKMTARRDAMMDTYESTLSAVSRAGGFDLAATEPGKRVDRVALAKYMFRVMQDYKKKHYDPAVALKEAGNEQRSRIENNENSEAYESRPSAQKEYEDNLEAQAKKIVADLGINDYFDAPKTGLMARAREASDVESSKRVGAEIEAFQKFLDEQVALIDPGEKKSDLRTAVKRQLGLYRDNEVFASIFKGAYGSSRDVEGKRAERLPDVLAQERENAARGSRSSTKRLNEKPTTSQLEQAAIASRAFKDTPMDSTQSVVDAYRLQIARAEYGRIVDVPDLDKLTDKELPPEERREARAQRRAMARKRSEDRLQALRYGLPNDNGERSPMFINPETGEPELAYEVRLHKRRDEVRSQISGEIRARLMAAYRREKRAGKNLTSRGRRLLYGNLIAREGFRQTGVDALTDEALKTDPEYQGIKDEYSSRRKAIIDEEEQKLGVPDTKSTGDLSEAARFRALDKQRYAAINMLGRFGLPVRSAVPRTWASEETLSFARDLQERMLWTHAATEESDPEVKARLLRGAESTRISDLEKRKAALEPGDRESFQAAVGRDSRLRFPMLISDDLASNLVGTPDENNRRGTKRRKFRSINQLREALPDTPIGREAKELTYQLPAPDILNTQGSTRPSSAGPGVATGDELAAWARSAKIAGGGAINPGDSPTGAAAGKGKRARMPIGADGGPGEPGEPGSPGGPGGRGNFFIKEPLKVHVVNFKDMPRLVASGGGGWARPGTISGGGGGSDTPGLSYRLGRDLTPEQALELERRQAERINRPRSETSIQSSITAMQAQQAIAPRSLMTRMIERASNMFGGRDEELARIARLNDVRTRGDRLNAKRDVLSDKLYSAEADSEVLTGIMANIESANPGGPDTYSEKDRKRYERAKSSHEENIEVVDHLTKVLGIYDDEIEKNVDEQEGLRKETGKTRAIMQNLGASVVGGVIGSMTTMGVAKVAQMAYQVASLTLGPSIERMMGNPATTARVQEQLGTAVRSSGGYTQAAVAGQVAGSGLNASAAQGIVATLQSRAQGVAASQATTAQLDLIRSSSRITQENRPYFGYDKSLFDTTGGLMGTFINGQASVSEQLRDIMKPLLSTSNSAGIDANTLGAAAMAGGAARVTGGTDQRLTDAETALDNFVKTVNVSSDGLQLHTKALTKDEKAANAALVKSMRSMPGMSGFADIAEKTGMYVTGATGKEPSLAGAVMQQFSANNIKLPASFLAQAMESQLKAQRFSELQQNRLQVGTVIPQRFAIGQAANPLFGTANAATAAIAAMAKDTGARVNSARLADITSTAQAVRTQARTGQIDAKSFVAARLPVAESEEFARNLDDAARIGNQIANLRMDTQVRQAALSANQFKESIRQAKISAADARAMANMRPNAAFNERTSAGNLGAYQRSDFLLGQQAAILGQGMSQRQINFQRAMAGFTAPGVTPEQRAANIEFAKYQADYEQKQLDISKKLTANQAAEFNITSARNVTMTANQVDLAQQGQDVAVETATNETLIAALTATLEKPMQSVEQTYSTALQIENDKISATASIISQTADSFKDVKKAMDDMVPAIDKWAAALGIDTTSGGKSGGKTGDRNEWPGAVPGGTRLPLVPGGKSTAPAASKDGLTTPWGTQIPYGSSQTSITFNISGNNIGTGPDATKAFDEFVKKLGAAASRVGLRVAY